MAASLGVTPLSLKAVVTSYILSLAVCIPVSGWLAERFGSRRVFLCRASALFTLSSVLCGLALERADAGGGARPQGIGGGDDDAGGPAARWCARFPKSELLRVHELRRHPGADRAAARARRWAA